MSGFETGGKGNRFELTPNMALSDTQRKRLAVQLPKMFNQGSEVTMSGSGTERSINAQGIIVVYYNDREIKIDARAMTRTESIVLKGSVHINLVETGTGDVLEVSTPAESFTMGANRNCRFTLEQFVISSAG